MVWPAAVPAGLDQRCVLPGKLETQFDAAFLGVCRREKSSHVESTTYKPLWVAKCLYVIDSTLVDIFIPTDF